MREQVWQFGNGLIGIYTPPISGTTPRPFSAIIPNTGIEHRVGPNRLHVSWARALAKLGIGTLRMDLGGLGDSDNTGSTNTEDIQSAMNEITTRTNSGQFLLLGLCSGAHDSHQVAIADARVIGAVFLDGYTYPTPKFQSNYVAQRVFSASRWKNFFAKSRQDSASDDKSKVMESDYYEQPSHDRASQDYASLIKRNVALFFCYTGEFQNVYNYQEQLTDAFPALKTDQNLGLIMLNNADHTLTRHSAREQLINEVKQWIERHPRLNSSAA